MIQIDSMQKERLCRQEIEPLTTLMDRALNTLYPGRIVMLNRVILPSVISAPYSYISDDNDDDALMSITTPLEKFSDKGPAKQKEYARIIRDLEEFMMSVDEDLDSSNFSGFYLHRKAIYPYTVQRIDTHWGKLLQLTIELV